MVMSPINVWVYDVHKNKKRRVTLRVATDKRDRRKSEVSTFVNFIHQKDAYIAMKVIEILQSLNAEVYTVHDNFITTASYCHLIPKIYRKVICDMGPPLLIINEFLFINLIKPVLKEEGRIDSTYKNRIIDKNILRDILDRYIPTHIHKNKKAYNVWKSKNQILLDSYEKYTRIVCGNPSNSELAHHELKTLHQRAWEKFNSKLNFEEGYPNYSVHY